MAKRGRRIIPPTGEKFEVMLDLRDGQPYYAHMTLRDCPLSKHHSKIRGDARHCSICNGTGYFLRFEEIAQLNTVPEPGPQGGEPPGPAAPDRTPAERPPAVLQAIPSSEDPGKD